VSNFPVSLIVNGKDGGIEVVVGIGVAVAKGRVGEGVSVGGSVGVKVAVSVGSGVGVGVVVNVGVGTGVGVVVLDGVSVGVAAGRRVGRAVGEGCAAVLSTINQ
jgi:hypothetical protein